MPGFFRVKMSLYNKVGFKNVVVRRKNIWDIGQEMQVKMPGNYPRHFTIHRTNQCLTELRALYNNPN